MKSKDENSLFGGMAVPSWNSKKEGHISDPVD